MSAKPGDIDWNPAADQALWQLVDLCTDYYWQEGPDQRCSLLRHSPTSAAGPNLLQDLPGQALWETGALVTGENQSWQDHLARRAAREQFRDLLVCLPASCGADAPRYLSVSGKARFDARGTFLGYHCFARDITQAHQSVLALRRFRAAVDMSGDMVYLVDRATMKFIDVNDTVCQRTGLSREQLLQRGPDLAVLQETPEELAARYDRLILEGGISHRTSTSVDAQGRTRDLETYSRATCIDGRWVIIGTMRDVTQRMELSRSAAKLQRMYSALSATNAAMLRAPDRDTLFQAVCDAVVHGGRFSVAAILTPEGKALRPTAAAGRYSERLLALRVPLDASLPAGQGLAGVAWRTGEATWSNSFLEDPRSLPWREQLQAGGVLSAAAFPLSLRGTPVAVLMFYSFECETFDAEIVALLASVVENIDFALDSLETARERREASRVLHESEERFRSLTHLSSDFFWEMDAALRLRHYDGHFANPVNRVAVTGLFGLPLWDMPGVSPCNHDWEQFRVLLQGRERFRDCEFRFVNQDGDEHFLAFSGEPMLSANGEFQGYRGIARDVTQRRRLAARMEFLATHDNLTGLPNRTLFNELLSHATRMATRYPRHAFALFFIDVDHFKQINDRHGHLLGDALLKEIAERLRTCLRTTDVVARLGGDEFVMLVHEVDAPQQLTRLAQNVIARFAGPLPVAGIDCHVTVSLGISVFGVDARDEHTLMTHADAAMYRAKELGKNTWQFYQPPS